MHRPSEIDRTRFWISYPWEISKNFHITSKYFCFLNKTLTARWVTHIKRDFSSYSYFRSSHQRCSARKDVLRNSTKFRVNTDVRVSFLITLQTLGLQFYQKETLAQVFFYGFCEISKNNFLTEHLRATASTICHIVTCFYKCNMILLRP